MEQLREIQPEVKFDPMTGNTDFKHVEMCDIKVYSDLVEVTNQEWEHALNAHNEKKEAFNRLRKYESYLLDDEDDIDAERVYCDIKNLQQEKFFIIK